MKKSNWQYFQKEYHLDDPALNSLFDDLKPNGLYLERACLIRNGKTICDFRVSNQNYMWIEYLNTFKSQQKDTSCHINHKAKTQGERVSGLLGKLDIAIEELILIKSVLEKFNK